MRERRRDSFYVRESALSYDLVTFYNTSYATLLHAFLRIVESIKIIEKEREREREREEELDGSRTSEPDNNMRSIPELPVEKVSRHRSDYSNYFRFKKEKVRASMVFMVAIQFHEPLWARI